MRTQAEAPSDNWLALPAEMRLVNIAIANSMLREILVDRCQADGVGFFQVQAPNVVVMDNVVIGEGAILSPFVTLTSNIKIGRHFHANLYSYVEHDCVIGDFVTFAPGAKCNGNVVIEDHAYIGAGAVIKQGLPRAPLVIGRGAVVGMGAVVTKSVPAGTTVVGPRGSALTGLFARAGSPFRSTGLSLPRRVLDQALVEEVLGLDHVVLLPNAVGNVL